MDDAESGGLNADEWAYYADGAWYDAEYVHIRSDIPYYASVAAETQDVLELACGTGRLSIPMAQAGGRVHGVDIVPGMIERAQDKRSTLPKNDRERLSFSVGDMRNVRMGRTFEAVVVAFNTLMHLNKDDDLAAALETVHAHLSPTGRFFYDLYTPHPAVVPRQDPSGRYDPQEMVDPRDSRRYVITENNQYDERQQINSMRFYYQELDRLGREVGEEWSRTLQLRVIFPREFDRWLHNAGFQIVQEWDQFDQQNPFSGTGGRRIGVARRRPT